MTARTSCSRWGPDSTVAPDAPADPIAAAHAFVRATIGERLGSDGRRAIAVQVTRHRSAGGEPTLCVAGARVEFGGGPAAWQWSCFLLRTTPTGARFEWAVEQATRAVLYRLGFP